MYIKAEQKKVDKFMLHRKSMKRNNNDDNHTYGKTTSYVGKSIGKATLFIVSSLFISAAILNLLGCFDFTTFAGLKQVITTRKPPLTDNRFLNRCDVVKNRTQQRVPISDNRIRSYLRSSTCPSYFRWIHEDLRPWKETGITRGMLEKARRKAHFRVIILDGKVYVKKYRKSIQTRDVFTLWGIVQLLRWYPGKLPDLELMFSTDDRPTVRSKNFKDQQHPTPPPIFRYCSDDASLDIVFPDWSFWGWAEVNIKPWAKSLMAIEEGNKITQWKDRVAYSYWRGNPNVAPTRRDLHRCNVSDQEDWNTRLYIQARKIGEEGSRFIREEVKMEYVYDYMFHLMNEYAKLLKFKPEIPWGATEITPESMVCSGGWRDFTAESMVMFPSEMSPCELPLPYNPSSLRQILERKDNLTRQVDFWEDQYFRDLTNDKKS